MQNSNTSRKASASREQGKSLLLTLDAETRLKLAGIAKRLDVSPERAAIYSINTHFYTLPFVQKVTVRLPQDWIEKIEEHKTPSAFIRQAVAEKLQLDCSQELAHLLESADAEGVSFPTQF